MRRGLRFPKWAAWSERRTTKPRQAVPRYSPYHHRLACEALEDRRLLSVAVGNPTLQLFDTSPATVCREAPR